MGFVKLQRVIRKIDAKCPTKVGFVSLAWTDLGLGKAGGYLIAMDLAT
jgi:hypothetical protein